jgi:hypothetical protein
LSENIRQIFYVKTEKNVWQAFLELLDGKISVIFSVNVLLEHNLKNVLEFTEIRYFARIQTFFSCFHGMIKPWFSRPCTHLILYFYEWRCTIYWL